MPTIPCWPNMRVSTSAGRSPRQVEQQPIAKHGSPIKMGHTAFLHRVQLDVASPIPQTLQAVKGVFIPVQMTQIPLSLQHAWWHSFLQSEHLIKVCNLNMLKVHPLHLLTRSCCSCPPALVGGLGTFPVTVSSGIRGIIDGARLYAWWTCLVTTSTAVGDSTGS